ncbi:MAG: penicillin-binding transpeptidase domain-containing protein, partial [Spirochaetales bacterium]
GISSVSPLEMTRAYATIANEGVEVEPLTVRYIEDQRGQVVAEPERELRTSQRDRGSELEVVSEQAAYIVTDMLQDAFKTGTMRGNTPDVPMAAKSGTTQNWSDAWVAGYSPLYTTSVWFGFDRGGRSLGTNQYGAALAGPVWTNYMNEIHSDRDVPDFERPENGLVDVEISEETGLLADSNYSGPTREEIFIEGTEPTEYSPSESERMLAESRRVNQLQSSAERRGLLPSRRQADSAIPTIDDILSGDSESDSEELMEDDIDDLPAEEDFLDDETEDDQDGRDDDDETEDDDDDEDDEDEGGNPLLD